MATIIDALVVTLGMDTKGMEQGVKKAENSLNSLSGIATKALGFVAGLWAGGAMMHQFIDNADAVNKLSQSLGINVEDLQAWQGAAANMGGSADSMTGSLKGLSDSLRSIPINGGDATVGMLQMLGIRARDATGHIRPATEVMGDIADKLSKMSELRALDYGKKLGFDQSTVMVLRQGRTALDDVIKRQKELGGYTKNDGEIARKATAAFDGMNKVFLAISAIIMRIVVPAFTTVVDSMTKIAIFVRKHEPFFLAAIGGLAAILIGRLLPALIRVGIANLIAWGPLILIFAAVILLVVAVAAVIDDLIIYIRGGDSQLESFWQTLGTGEEVGKKIAETWEVLKSIFGAVIETVIQLVRWFFALFGVGGWNGMQDAAYKIASAWGKVYDKIASLLNLKQLLAGLWSWFDEKIGGMLAKISKVGSFMGFGGADGTGGTPSATAAAALPAGGSTSTKNVQTDVSIGQITVQTQATDAQGIAGSIGGAMNDNTKNLIYAADSGVRQ